MGRCGSAMPARQGSDVGRRPSARISPSSTRTFVEPAVAQEIGDAVGDVALRHAVQRHRHAGPAKADPRRVELDRAPVDPCQGGRRAPPRWAGRIGAGVGEVLGIEVPERLHGDVEGPVRSRRRPVPRRPAARPARAGARSSRPWRFSRDSAESVRYRLKIRSSRAISARQAAIACSAAARSG